MSSIVKKIIMSVTGLILFGFVVGHMLGNLQIFLGPQALNDYAQHLKELPLLVWTVRIILLIAIILHMITAIRLAFENKAARPIAYASKKTVHASLASRTMVMSGLIIFAFIVYHLLHFTFGAAHPEFFHAKDALGRHDVYSMVVKSFQVPLISGCYVLAMLLLCMHLRHGVFSLFQSLGLNNDKWNHRFKLIAIAASSLIFIGNVSIPAAVLMGVLK